MTAEENLGQDTLAAADTAGPFASSWRRRHLAGSYGTGRVRSGVTSTATRRSSAMTRS